MPHAGHLAPLLARTRVPGGVQELSRPAVPAAQPAAVDRQALGLRRHARQPAQGARGAPAAGARPRAGQRHRRPAPAPRRAGRRTRERRGEVRWHATMPTRASATCWRASSARAPRRRDGADPAAAAARERVRLASGALTWDLAQQLPQRQWEAKKTLAATDRELEQVARARRRAGARAARGADGLRRVRRAHRRARQAHRSRCSRASPRCAREQQVALQEIAVAELHAPEAAPGRVRGAGALRGGPALRPRHPGPGGWPCDALARCAASPPPPRAWAAAPTSAATAARRTTRRRSPRSPGARCEVAPDPGVQSRPGTRDRGLSQVPRRRAAGAAARRGAAPPRRPGDGPQRRPPRRAATRPRRPTTGPRSRATRSSSRPTRRTPATTACSTSSRARRSRAASSRRRCRRSTGSCATTRRRRYRDEAQFRRGELLFTAREYVRAEQAFAQVLRGEAGNAYRDRALYMQGWSLFKQGRLDDALASFFGVLDAEARRASATRTGRSPA